MTDQITRTFHGKLSSNLFSREVLLSNHFFLNQQRYENGFEIIAFDHMMTLTTQIYQF